MVRTGGKIAIMQNYIVPRLPGCDFEEIITILLRIKQYPKIVTVQKKIYGTSGRSKYRKGVTDLPMFEGTPMEEKDE